MDVFEEHNYARPHPETVAGHIDLLPGDLDFGLGIKMENDVWFSSLESLNGDVDVGELLKLGQDEGDSVASLLKIPGEELNFALPIASKGSPVSDAGYDSTAASNSPDTSSGSDSDSSAPSPRWTASTSSANLDAFLGDLQDVVKGVLDSYANTEDSKAGSQETLVSRVASLGESSLADANLSKGGLVRESYLPPVGEKRKRSSHHNSDRISGPTAFLGNAVCWESGLKLTEEEKETLLTDGCSVPTSLPLSVDEEKAIKLARRKIKNKISAQESRRKKKEFVDTMQHRVELSSRENHHLQQKVEDLEKKNKNLQEELRALKQAVARQQNPARFGMTAATAQASLLVLTVCFALAFPTMVGQGKTGIFLPTKAEMSPAEDSQSPAFDYTMSNFRSRTLKQFGGEFEEEVFEEEGRYEEVSSSEGSPMNSLEDIKSVPMDVDDSQMEDAIPLPSSPRAFFSLQGSPDDAHILEPAMVVVKENVSVSIPA